MPTFLPYAEKVFWVDGRVLAGIRGSKGLPLFPTATKSFTTWEEFFLYLAVSLVAVSTALVRRQGSKAYVLRQPGASWCRRYSPMEKLAFALVTVARKLKPYF